MEKENNNAESELISNLIASIGRLSTEVESLKIRTSEDPMRFVRKHQFSIVREALGEI